ncbi:MAG: N-acetylmuramoyl-L-alanine amidase [Beijerinckiaceae bacterium]|nr:N-acetylmuramoyl-L-alanine amidase [Beijerinckiaceae bacterium]
MKPESDSPLVTKIVPSPNQGERKEGRRPDMIVLHYTGMQDGVSALQQLTNPMAEVSSHYLIWEDGRIFQLVPESARAWHAGRGQWGRDTDINSCSIGIEIVNGGHDYGLPDFPAEQIDAVIALCRDIATRWSIPPHRILAHSDTAPARKADPGEKFPWARLADDGIGHFVLPAPLTDGLSFARGAEGPPVQALQAMLSLYGYALPVTGVFDDATEQTVTAFQRHFRPARIDGIADLSTIQTLRNLIAALPAV